MSTIKMFNNKISVDLVLIMEKLEGEVVKIKKNILLNANILLNFKSSSHGIIWKIII